VAVEPNGTIVLHVTAPPVESRANKEVAKCLAKKLGKPSSKVKVVAGLHSKTKVIEILDTNPTEVARVLGVPQQDRVGKI
jgi:hypothetical protein